MGVIAAIIKYEKILIFKGATTKKSQLREVGHFLEKVGLRKYFFNFKCGKELPQKE